MIESIELSPKNVCRYEGSSLSSNFNGSCIEGTSVMEDVLAL